MAHRDGGVKSPNWEVEDTSPSRYGTFQERIWPNDLDAILSNVCHPDILFVVFQSFQLFFRFFLMEKRQRT